MTEYVKGFYFIPGHPVRVVLIQKNRPDWQAGKLNGVGGHVEPGEFSLVAMRREFEEEAGVKTETAWRKYAELVFPDAIIHCYFTWGDGDGIHTCTDEEILAVPITALPENVLPNLRFLIPMALSGETGVIRPAYWGSPV